MDFSAYVCAFICLSVVPLCMTQKPDGCGPNRLDEYSFFSGIVHGKITGRVNEYEFSEVYDHNKRQFQRTLTNSDTNASRSFYFFEKTQEIFKIEDNKCSRADSSTLGQVMGPLTPWTKLNEFFGESSLEFFNQTYSAMSLLQAWGVNVKNADFNSVKFDKGYRLCFKDSFVIEYIATDKYLPYLNAIILYVNSNGEWNKVDYTITDERPSLAIYRLYNVGRMDLVPYGFMCRRKDEIESMRPKQLSWPTLYQHRITVQNPQKPREWFSFTVAVDTTTNLEYYVESETVSYIVDKEMDIVFRTDEREGKCSYFRKELAYKAWPKVKRFIDLASDRLWNVQDEDNYLGNVTVYSQINAVYERYVEDLHLDTPEVYPGIITKSTLPDSRRGNYDTETLYIKTFTDPKRTQVKESLILTTSRQKTDIDRSEIFNIVSCLQSGPMKKLTLKFKSSQTVVEVENSFKTVTTKALTNKLATIGVRPIRFSVTGLEKVNDNNLDISLTLRHAYVNFKTTERTTVDGVKLVTQYLSPEACAAMCQKVDNCAAYTICGPLNQRVCNLVSGDYKVKVSINCTTSVKNFKTKYPTIDDLENRIETEWLQNGLVLNIDYGRQSSLTLSEIVPDSSSTDKVDDIKQDEVFADIVSMIENQTSILLRVEKVDLKEVNNLGANLYEEYYDFKARRGEVKEFNWDTWRKDNLHRRSIFFHDTSEYFYINEKTFYCKTTTITKPISLFLPLLMFPEPLLNAMEAYNIDIAGPSSLLRLANATHIPLKKDLLGLDDYAHVYVGKASFGNTDLTIYTAKLLVDNKIIHRPLKAQIDVDGKPVTLFTFTAFTPSKEPNRITSLPDGFGCHRVTSTQLPVVPLSNLTDYQVNFELIVKDNEVSPPQQFGVNIDAARNLNYGLHAYTMRLNPLSREVYRVVFDKSKMTSYWTQLLTKTCEIQKTNNSFGLNYPQDEDAYNILAKDIVISNPYDYLGTKVIRDSKVNVFETSHSYTSQRDKTSRSAVITLFFRVDATSSALAEPLQIRIRDFNSTNENQITREFILNVASVTAPIPDPSVTFDISGCFEKPQEYTWFEMSFVSLKSHASLYLNERKLVQKAFYKMLDFIPPTRIPKVMVDISPNTIVITAKLLERTPVEYSYRKLENKQVNKDVILTKSTIIQSLEICGQLCLSSSDCFGFSFCPVSYECDVTVGGGSPQYVADQIESTALNAVECNTYIKTNLTYEGTAGDDTLNALLDRLEGATVLGQLLLQLPAINSEGVVNYNDVNNNAEFTAIDIKKNVEPGFNLDLMSSKNGLSKQTQEAYNRLAGDILNNYSMKQAMSKIDFEKVKGQNGRRMIGLSIGECKSLCEDDEFCQSFSFCPSSGDCVTSSIPETGLTSITKYDFECSVLTKGYLASYNFLNNHYFVENKTVVIARSEETCAEACSNYKDFECLSFDFCRQEKQYICSLYKVHSQVRSSMGGLRYSATCGHYSRKYTYDYKPFPAKKLKSTDLLTVKSVSPDDCAIQCKKENCFTFEYCQIQVYGSSRINDVCRLSGETELTLDNMDRNINCTVYSQNIQSSKPDSARVFKYRSGLGVFFALLALVLGAGISFGVLWYKERGLSTVAN